MRLVIDLQTAQLDFPRHPESTAFALVREVAENAGDIEVFVVLNGMLQQSVQPLRDALADWLPQENIRVWQALAPVTAADMENRGRREIAEYLREAAIAGLKPDVVIVTAMFAGFEDNAVASIGVFLQDVPVIAFVDRIPEPPEENSAARAHFTRQTGFLRAADRILLSSCTAEEMAHRCGIPKGQCAGDADPVGAIRDIVTRRASHAVNERPQTRPRLAYFSPLPPLRSGIGDYSTELIPALAAHYEIDIVVAQENVAGTAATQGRNILSVEEFLPSAHQYDRVLYHVGNAEFHLHMFECLEKVPGVVVLHDFFLSGAYGYQEFEAKTPYAWGRELYRSHGYGALVDRYRKARSRLDEVAVKYPSNFSVLSNAQGVIVHSEHSRQLAAEWYGKDFSKDWACIPHLRVPERAEDRREARARLGLHENDFVVCSFGKLGFTKHNQRLLDAFLLSDLVDDPRCHLVFVGENSDDEYGRELVRRIRERGLEGRVRITGWADRELFRDHLSAADLAVQLRTFSRGETSGTVLDCMNHGVPVVVNACGPMAELPEDAVWMLPERFEDVQLVEALESLRGDPALREQLGAGARQVILERHDPGACARAYAAAIERFHAANRFGRKQLIDSLAGLESFPGDNATLAELAVAVARNVPQPQPARTLFVDVSVTSRTDLKTGIERVTRALLHELTQTPPAGYRVEPVYLAEHHGAWHYRHARRYTLGLLDCPDDILQDDVVEPRAGDVLFSADLAADLVARADASGLYAELKRTGVNIAFMVHDLLPMTMPDVFPPQAGEGFEKWLRTIVRISDTVVCVSRSVAEELRDWLKVNDISRNPRLELRWSHHGADIHASVPTYGMPGRSRGVLGALRNKPSFLMVGTLEPRKGYLQAVEAFNRLWREGVDANLVIVGKEGWQDLPDDRRRDIPLLVKLLQNHPERGRRLFWLEDISDEYLEKVYAACDCLIAASAGEGFGLPLIEASRHDLPILARDIPVFREVAGEHATYFKGSSAEALASAVKAHITEQRGSAGHAPIPALNWNQSAHNLAASVAGLNDFVQAPRQRSAGRLALLSDTGRRRFYVDVSVVSQDDFRTGIQRTVRALFAELVAHPPAGYDVYPVRLVEGAGAWSCEIDMNFFGRYCKTFWSEGPVPEGEIEVEPGDILLGLDLAGSHVVHASRYGLYERLREAGALVYFVLYDLLPVTAPEYFPPADSEGHADWLKSIARADGVIGISRSVADEFRNWCRKYCNDAPKVGWFHLGADIENSAPSHGLPADAREVLTELGRRPSFLMVGTVEPRKGYSQAVQAFRELWAQGADVNLVIVGKTGWNVDSLVRELRGDPEAGRRLFWLESISDEYLEAVYDASACLIAASVGEGFGLPLIEAARHGVPLILRDIPVFREVAGVHALYFNGFEPADLATAVREWLALRSAGEAPGSEDLRRFTWRESARQLKHVILNEFANGELQRQTEGKFQ